ncbi:MAG: hypothetical protein ACLGJE_13155 [Gammaproteobacteria bacterium]
MSFDLLAYPDKIVIADTEFEAQRNLSKGSIIVPYTEEPDIGIGDFVIQKVGRREVVLKVLDVQFMPGGTLGVGTRHPNLLTLKVENMTAKPHLPTAHSSTYHIGSISGEQIQVGNDNSQTVNISIQNLADAISKSGDPVAKSALRNLLENNTVASILGAGASALLALL